MRLFLALSLAISGFAVSASAQERRASHCIALAQSAPGLQYLHRASFGTPVPDFSVRITYVNHATFVIETPTGVTAATDYTGFLGTTAFAPDIATMNNAHSSHWTAYPDPRIPHILQGWARGGVAADHDLVVGDLYVRNVPTDVRGGFDGSVRTDGNSIFVFEVEGLCIGHLGHLHHEPDDMQYAALGRMDVVMAAVDGGVSLDTETMVRVLQRLRSSIVIPMHWFSRFSLDRFLSEMSETHAIQLDAGASLDVSLRSLPGRPTIVVLEPEYLAE